MIEQLRQYDKHLKPVYNDTRDILMLSSGSHGNSLIIKPYQLIVDLGLSYKYYDEELLRKIKYVFLTHQHGDHFNITTINKIMKNQPHIKFIMRDEMFDILKDRFAAKNNYNLNMSAIQIIKENEDIVFDLDNDEVLVVNAHKTDHGDIENTAYTFKGSVDVDEFEQPTILYASDLIDTEPTELGDGLPSDETYDLMFLEANYDHQILVDRLYEIVNSDDSQYNDYQKGFLNRKIDRLKDEFNSDILKDLLESRIYAPKEKGNLRHLSENQAFKYVFNHLSNDGLYIPLHASSQFGTLHQK